MKRILKALREFAAVQQRLHDNRMDGFGRSGLEARTAMRRLRWDGEKLVGEELPI